MKCKVRLTHTVEMFVEGPSEDAIQEWLLFTTPQEAKDMALNPVTEHFDEEIICNIMENSDVDYVIEE